MKTYKRDIILDDEMTYKEKKSFFVDGLCLCGRQCINVAYPVGTRSIRYWCPKCHTTYECILGVSYKALESVRIVDTQE